MNRPTRKYDREKMRENYWKPIDEQANVLIELIQDGQEDYSTVIDDIDTYCDKVIIGNRLNMINVREAIRLKIKQAIFPDVNEDPLSPDESTDFNFSKDESEETRLKYELKWCIGVIDMLDGDTYSSIRDHLNKVRGIV